MESFESKPREKMRAVIYGVEYLFNKPSVGSIRKIQKDLKSAHKDATGDSHMDVMTAFMVDLGLPEDVLNDLSVEDWADLCDYVTGVKKK